MKLCRRLKQGCCRSCRDPLKKEVFVSLDSKASLCRCCKKHGDGGFVPDVSSWLFQRSGRRGVRSVSSQHVLGHERQRCVHRLPLRKLVRSWLHVMSGVQINDVGVRSGWQYSCCDCRERKLLGMFQRRRSVERGDDGWQRLLPDSQCICGWNRVRGRGACEIHVWVHGSYDEEVCDQVGRCDRVERERDLHERVL